MYNYFDSRLGRLLSEDLYAVSEQNQVIVYDSDIRMPVELASAKNVDTVHLQDGYLMIFSVYVTDEGTDYDLDELIKIIIKHINSHPAPSHRLALISQQDFVVDVLEDLARSGIVDRQHLDLFGHNATDYFVTRGAEKVVEVQDSPEEKHEYLLRQVAGIVERQLAGERISVYSARYVGNKTPIGIVQDASKYWWDAINPDRWPPLENAFFPYRSLNQLFRKYRGEARKIAVHELVRCIEAFYDEIDQYAHESGWELGHELLRLYDTEFDKQVRIIR